MYVTTEMLLKQYTEVLANIYGRHLKAVILYGSYARGDYTKDSDVDIMILLDLTDMEIKNYRHALSGETYDFNMDHEIHIKLSFLLECKFLWIDIYNVSAILWVGKESKICHVITGG